jgi:ABC-type glycerol-3-phosphate transport system substrate-binding protein
MKPSVIPAFRIAIAFGVIAVFGLLAIIFLSLSSSRQEQYSLDLEMWGPVDDSDVFREINEAYRETHPYVRRVDYKKMLIDEYKRDLLNALAAGTAPDVFLIRNTWIPEFQDKIVPAPESLLGVATVQNEFVDTVARDVVIDGAIYGLPLSVDSLALYYNKDLFNLAGIVNPPATWDEFLLTTRRLTQENENGVLRQSGAALGTAQNINRSTDILSALFLQLGTGVEFLSRESTGSFVFGNEGVRALEFYAQFADIDSPYYSWNSRQDYSIDAFQEGSLAMMLNYSWHYETIARKNSRLNFGVAPLPQFSGLEAKNFPNYWVLVVSKNKMPGEGADPAVSTQVRTFEAWQYIRFLTLSKGGEYPLANALSGNQKSFLFGIDPAKKYAEKTQAPAARRDILGEQQSDPVLGPFATGNLIARSWRQENPDETEKAIAESIESVVSGSMDARSAIRLLEERIRTFSRR